MFCWGGAADGGSCYVQRLRGRAVRDAFCLWQNATVVGVFGAAFYFVCGLLRTVWLMRRGVLSAAKYYEVRFISRDVLLCLRAAADGRICHVQRLRGHAALPLASLHSKLEADGR